MFVLNTRPQGQADNLNNLIKNAGGDFFNLPCISIIPVQFEDPCLDNVDYVIFQSANAVRYFLQKHQQKKLPPVIIAIGAATKQSLESNGFKNIIVPENYNSNSILNLPLLKNIKNKKIIIFSGENPKLILSEALKKRCATVQFVYCYRRVLPTYNMDLLFPELSQKKIDCIVSTSFESLKNLLVIFQAHRHWLFSKTLCVISDDMCVFAKAEGFVKVIQSKNATDLALVQKLLQ